MDKLTIEELRDIINALKHYQNHNISLSNPRYKHFDSIINTIENQIANNKNLKFNRKNYLDWFEETNQEETLDECIRGN